MIRALAAALALVWALTAAVPALSAGPVAAPPATGAARVGAETLETFEALAADAAAQAFAAGEPGPRLPPDAVDRLLARLTDAELRAFLRAELAGAAPGSAAPQAPAATPPPMGDGALARAGRRLAELGETVAARLMLWTAAVADLPARGPDIAARLATASHGGVGAFAASLALGAAALGAAAALGRASAPLRRLVAAAERASYGGRLARAAMLAALDLARPALFVAVTVTLAPLLRAPLGPMWDYVWIWHAGVSAGWAALILGRRLFAADLPALRIAALDDTAAATLDALLRRCVRVAVGGWLLAGLSPTLGAGIGPAILTVLAAGTLVALMLGGAVLRNRAAIAAAAAGVFGATAAPRGAPLAVAAAAAPFAMAAYVGLGWAWWAAHWLESGVQRLAGPLGLVVALLLLPALDRLGAEIADALTARVEAADRLRAALRQSWRAALGLGTALAALSLWGLDPVALVHGPDAPRWAGAAADLALTLAIAWLAWRLVVAALPEMVRDPLTSEGDEGGGVVDENARRNTLTPLARGSLKVVLVCAAVLSGLSSLGVDVAPLLASAGIVGIAVGFGAQTLVRDVFSGVFFLVDDAFRIGEYVEFGDDLKGQVEAISLRSLRLRHHLGPVITVPFGELRAVTNHSRDWVILKLDFRMEPDTDPAQVKRIVKAVGAEVAADPELGSRLLEPPKSQGVSMIDEDSALVIRVKFRCRPGAQWALRREVYHRLTKAFAENGVRTARRRIEVVGGPPEAAAGAGV